MTSEWVDLCFPCGPQSEKDIKSFYEGICGDFTDATESYILSCFGQPTTDSDDFSSTTGEYYSTTDSDDFYYSTIDEFYVTRDDEYYSPTDDDDNYYSPTTDDDDYVYDDYYSPPTPSPVPERTPAPSEDPTL